MKHNSKWCCAITAFEADDIMRSWPKCQSSRAGIFTNRTQSENLSMLL